MASEIVGEKREGSATVTKGEGFNLKFKETYKFLVVTDSTSVTREEVLLDTPGLPVVGFTSIGNNLVCTSKSAERNATHPLYWDVTCEFESGEEQQKQDENNPSDNPETWIPIFKIDSFSVKERVIFTDYSDPVVKIQNSAKQPFDQPLTKKMTLCQASFVQYESASTTLKSVMDRNMTINKFSFMFGGEVVDERTLLCEVTSAELGYYNRYKCLRVGYKLTYDPDKHEERIIDVGSSYIDGGKLKPYMDDTNTFRIVGFLNGAGAKNPVNDFPVALRFIPYRQLDFSSFIRI